VTLLRELAAAPDRIAAQTFLSRFLASVGSVDEAAQVAFATAERHPSDLAALEQLASILTDVRDKERLVPVVGRLRTIAPTADATRYYAASLFFLDGQVDRAVAEARLLVAANPRHARGHNLLGAALAIAGRREGARDAFLASLKAEPRDPSTYTNLGLLELEGGNRDAGLQRLAEALMLDPDASAAREAYTRETARDARP
jgi:tetratricopeptide (TPR) repeat protein